MPALLVDLGTGHQYVLREGANTIGRQAGNDVVLPGLAISRFHAEIRFESGAWVLEDQGSSYGTFLNGKRIEGAAPLAHGDRIRLGVSQLSPDGEFNLDFRKAPDGDDLTLRLPAASRAVVERKKVDAGRWVFERGEHFLLARLEGIFRRREMDALAAGLRGEISMAPRDVVLDLRKVEYMNSYALSVMVELALGCRDRGRALRAFGAAGSTRKLLELPGAANPIELAADEAEALRPRP